MKLALNAGEPNVIGKRGNYILLADSVEPVDIFIEYMNGDTETLKFYVQRGYTAPSEFKQLRVLSEVNQTIEIEVMRGRVEDGRLSGEVGAQVKAGAYSGLPMVTFGATKLHTVPENANRKEVILKASLDNASAVFIGSAENVGIPIEPGEGWAVETWADLVLWGNTGDQVFIGETVY